MDGSLHQWTSEQWVHYTSGPVSSVWKQSQSHTHTFSLPPSLPPSLPLSLPLSLSLSHTHTHTTETIFQHTILLHYSLLRLPAREYNHPPYIQHQEEYNQTYGRPSIVTPLGPSTDSSVCQRERERERDKQTDRQTDRDRERTDLTG